MVVCRRMVLTQWRVIVLGLGLLVVMVLIRRWRLSDCGVGAMSECGAFDYAGDLAGILLRSIRLNSPIVACSSSALASVRPSPGIDDCRVVVVAPSAVVSIDSADGESV